MPKNPDNRKAKTRELLCALDKLGYATTNLLPGALLWEKMCISFGVYSIHNKELKKFVIADMMNMLSPNDIIQYGKMFMYVKLGLCKSDIRYFLN